MIEILTLVIVLVVIVWGTIVLGRHEREIKLLWEYMAVWQQRWEFEHPTDSPTCTPSADECEEKPE